MSRSIPTAPEADAPSGWRRLLRLSFGSILGGVAIGAAAWLFLEALDLVTRIRVEHRVLVSALPFAGLAMGLAHHRLGGRSREGSLLILRQIRRPEAEREWVPARMAPLVGVLSVGSHLFGASVGREGAALQIGGSLVDQLNRLLRIDGRDRRVLLIAALGGAFGAVFGVPLAGFVFGLELQIPHLPERPRSRARLLAVAAAPTLAMSFLGDAVCRLLGRDHGLISTASVTVSPRLIGVWLAVGLASGIAATLFVSGTAAVRRVLGRITGVAPLRPALGGILVLLLIAPAGEGPLGLSLPLRDAALLGEVDSFGVPAWKLLFTILCVGAGFLGGEVTPLFVVGSTLGGAVAAVFGIDPAVGAVIGFAAVFAGAARTPLACAVLTAEMFGLPLLLPALVVTMTAQITGSRHGLYGPGPRPSGDRIGDASRRRRLDRFPGQSQPRRRKLRWSRKQPRAMRPRTTG